VIILHGDSNHTLTLIASRKFLQRWATGWTIGVLGFHSRRGLGIFLFTTLSRTALGLTQPPIQWVPGDPSLGIKRPRREDYSPQSSAEFKNAWSYASTPPYVFMALCLVKHSDNCTFYLILHKRKVKIVVITSEIRTEST